MRIIQISDLHSRSNDLYRGVDTTFLLQKILRKILKFSPDLVILTGDIADPPSPSNYEVVRFFLAAVQANDIKAYITLGNHDNKYLSKKVLCDVAEFAPFAIPLNNRCLIGLDSITKYGGKGHFPTLQLDFVSKFRKNYNCISVFSHHHISPIGVKQLDASSVDNVEDFLIAAGNTLDSYFFGHIHQPYNAKFVYELEQDIYNLDLYGCPSAVKNFPVIQNYKQLSEGFRLVEFDMMGAYETYLVNASDWA